MSMTPGKLLQGFSKNLVGHLLLAMQRSVSLQQAQCAQIIRALAEGGEGIPQGRGEGHEGGCRPFTFSRAASKKDERKTMMFGMIEVECGE